MIRFAFLLTLIFHPFWLTAQVVQSARIEFPISSNFDNYEVIPTTSGMFLFRKFVSPESNAIDIIKLDTALTSVWQGFLPVDPNYKLAANRADKDQIYFILQHTESAKNDFILYTISQSNGDFIRYDIKNYIPFNLIDFQITSTSALMGGYFNRVPVVTFFDLKTRKSKILPGLLNESGELTQIKTYPDGSFDVLIAAGNFQGQKTIWIKNYSPEGELLRNIALEPGENKNLIFARSIKTHDNLQIVAGVFGVRRTEWSRGFFMASLDPTGLQQTRYYNFPDLENFFKFMKAKRESRVKKRIERRKVKGKKIRFNYRFLVHELIPYKDQFILLGEAFYPKYVTPERSSGGFFMPYSGGNRLIRDGRVFDGYYYTHAVVMGFDPEGKVLWDNSFEINDVKTFTLEQFVKIEIKDDIIVLLYLYENQLRSKIIRGNEVLEGKTFEQIKAHENEISLRENTTMSKLDYWYGAYFYACGVQEIVNPKFGRRRVFYVNKLTYAL